MAKYKIINKKDQTTTTVVRSAFGKIAVNERELIIFEKNLLPGFFHPKVEGKRKIIYTAPKSIPLNLYVKKNLTIHKFYNVLAQIVEIVKKTDAYKLYVYNLILDDRLIFVKETTSELFFLYEPLLDRNNCTNLFSFLEDFVRNLKPEDKMVEFEKQRFLIFLRNPQIHKIEDIEQFILQAYPQIYQQIDRSGKGKSGFITTNPIDYMQHYQGKEDIAAEQDQAGTVLLQDDEEGTTLLEEEGTTLLGEQNIIQASLLRCSNGVTTQVNKNVFTIGKAKENDLCILDNRTVSRRHAKIFVSGSEFMLQDTNSTNHTYINGKVLSDDAETLHDGDRIRLSDEEFEFFLNI